MTLELFGAHGQGVYSCQEDLLKQGSVKYRLLLPSTRTCYITKRSALLLYYCKTLITLAASFYPVKS